MTTGTDGCGACVFFGFGFGFTAGAAGGAGGVALGL